MGCMSFFHKALRTSRLNSFIASSATVNYPVGSQSYLLIRKCFAASENGVSTELPLEEDQKRWTRISRRPSARYGVRQHDSPPDSCLQNSVLSQIQQLSRGAPSLRKKVLRQLVRSESARFSFRAKLLFLCKNQDEHSSNLNVIGFRGSSVSSFASKSFVLEKVSRDFVVRSPKFEKKSSIRPGGPFDRRRS